MKTVLVFVEGQAEETFIREVLDPYLQNKNVCLIPKLAVTRRVKSGPDFKGGIVSYGKAKNDITRLLKDSSVSIVTTMIDFYGLPTDFPGKATLPNGSGYQKVLHLENEFQKDIASPKFLPYLSLHEFEAMIFVAPEHLLQVFPKVNKNQELAEIIAKFNSPEEINDDPQTAPSKRLEKLFPKYQKTSDGPLIVIETGVDRIRSQCFHFNEWLTKLEKLGGVNNLTPQLSS